MLYSEQTQSAFCGDADTPKTSSRDFFFKFSDVHLALPLLHLLWDRPTAVNQFQWTDGKYQEHKSEQITPDLTREYKKMLCLWQN